MSCLFCGKEIGTLRLLRKEEFCSTAHRRLYKERLGKVLGTIGAPEPAPAPISGFRPIAHLIEGNSDPLTSLRLLTSFDNGPCVRLEWPLSIPSVLGCNRRPPVPVAPRVPGTATAVAFPVQPTPGWVTPQAPVFSFNEEARDFEELRQTAAVAVAEPAGAMALETEPPSGSLNPATRLAPAPGPIQLPLFEVGVSQVAPDAGDLAALLQPCPVARWVEPNVLAERLPAEVILAIPQFEIDACVEPLPTVVTRPPLSEAWMPSLAPAPVARWVAPISAEIAESIASVVLPHQVVAACLEPLPTVATRPPLSEAWMTSPAPAPVARWLAPVSAEIAESIASVVLPHQVVAACLEPLPTVVTRPPLSEAWMPSPAPVPVARWVAPISAEIAESIAGVALPRFDTASCVDPLPSLEDLAPSACETWMASPQPMPVARMVLASMSEGTADFVAAVQPPPFEIAACLEPLPSPEKLAPRPPMSEVWMPSPAPGLVARMVTAAIEEAPQVAAHTVAARYAAPPVAAAETTLLLPACESYAPVPEAEAALVNAFPSLITDSALSGTVQMPGMPSWQASDAMRHPHAGPAPTIEPEPVETWPSVPPCEVVRTESTPRLCLPLFGLQPISGSARLDCSSEPDMAPRPALPAPAAARVVAPMLRTAAPAGDVGGFLQGFGDPAKLPLAGIAETDFHCRHTPGVPSKRLRAVPIPIHALEPRLALRPIFDRWEDILPQKNQPKGAPKKVVSMPRAVRQVATSKQTRHLVGTIAAGLFLGAVLYFGASGARQHRMQVEDTVAANEVPAVEAPAQRPSGGTFSRIKEAVSNRAAASWSDSFRGGMASWGTSAKSWAPGWTRSTDGYVQPGSLAIFRPTANYTDYQLEFFGQIEHSSLDWVVRAKDSQNYYAMKLKVVESGLRPIVAMVHYSVSGGKRGRSHELPLSVMVHNNRPMQVLVDVHGSHFTASVDGQQVDSWTDQAPSTGGVGFFAEAGEKARLYWMRVSKNEDFLGRVCAYFTGSTTTAELWPQDPYGRPHSGGGDSQPVEALGVAGFAAVRRRRTRGFRPAKRGRTIFCRTEK